MKSRNIAVVDGKTLCFQLLATCALAAFAAPSLAADLLSPVTQGLKKIDPVPLVCFLRGGNVVYVENSTTDQLVAGTHIFWSTAAGDRGKHDLAYALHPGEMVDVAGVRDSTDCSARFYPKNTPIGTYQPPPDIAWQPPVQ
jgi:hypothetical protein